MAFDTGHFPVNGGSYPPFGQITDTNHGSYIIIATWIFASISVLFVVVRLALRARQSHRFGPDNAFVVGALVFAIGQSISASESVQYGLGRHLNALGEDDLRSYYRTVLASEVLSVLVFVFSKLSLIILIANITPKSSIRLFVKCYIVFTILWGISYILSRSLKCGTSISVGTETGGCINQKALLFTHGIINIVTDFLLTVLPAFILWTVQLNVEKKLVILGLFSIRTLVPITVGVQLGVLGPYLSGNDPTWNYLYPALWDHTHLSVITACIPSIKPFLDNLQSSLINSRIPQHHQSPNFFELGPLRSSRKKRSAALPQIPTSSRTIGLSATTEYEIKGGFDPENASTKALTANVIHQQLDVDIVVVDADEREERGPSMV